MRAEDLVRGVVRVWSDGEGSEIVGTGVLVAPDLVLTCAHVAARAWRSDAASDDGLGRRLRIDLPATAPLRFIEATVVRWLPRRPAPGGAYDLAGLRLEPGSAGGATPLPLVVEEAPWGRPCRAFGFPAGRPDGSYANGELRDVLANGWMLLKGGADAREFTRPGYSGGPVVTEAGMVGLLTEGDRDVRVREAVMVPVRAILDAWPELRRSVSRSPFPGLAAFTSADAAYFRGRGTVADELAKALASAPHLVVLAGPSGSGKSSLIAAGVLPRLAAPGPDGEAGWSTVVWRPGQAPYPALAHALLRARHPEAEEVQLSVESARLARDLDADRVALADVLAQRPESRWVIAIDQPEDLLIENGDTVAYASPSRRLFDTIVAAQSDPRLEGRLAVLVAVRTDDLDTLLRNPLLIGRGNGEVVRYLGAVEDLREVIEGPLRETGVASLEPGLTDRLLTDVGEVPNPLPLLQFTLASLWRDRRAGRLSHAAYDELGGVRRALANHAERTVAGLGNDQVAIVRDVLLQLGRPGLGASVARRAARFDELGERGRMVVPRLADARLVVTDRGADGVERVEVVHEALFEHWPRLRDWWREAVGFRRWQESLRFAVRVWREGGEHPADLLQGPRLRAAESYLRDRPGTFTAEELSYVMRSGERELQESEATRRSLRRELQLRRRLNTLLAVGMTAAIALAASTIWQMSSVQRLRGDAERLFHAATEANMALSTLTEELEASLGESRVVLSRRLGIQAVAMSTAPTTFGGDMRLAALMASHAVHLDPGPTSYDHLLRVLQAHPSYRATLATQATAVALSPDGRTIAVGDAMGGIERWDGLTGARHGGRVEGHHLQVTALAFSPDGRVLLSGGIDGRVLAWDAVSLRPRGTLLDGDGGPIVSLGATTDGRTWVGVDLAGTVRSWELSSGAGLAVVGAGAARPAASVVGGQNEVGSAFRDSGIVVLASAMDGLDATAAEAHRSWASHLAIHPSRPWVALAMDGRIVVLDARTLAEAWSVPMPAGDLGGLAFDGDGDLVVATFDGQLQAWSGHGSDPATPRWASRVAGVRALAPGVGPGQLLLATEDGSLRRVDLSEQRVFEQRLRGHDQPLTTVLTNAGLIVTRSLEGRVVTWDREPREGLGTFVGRVESQPAALAAGAGADQVYVGGQDGSLTRFSLADATLHAVETEAHTATVNGIAAAAGGLVTVGRDGLMVMRDPFTLEPLAVPLRHHAPLWRVVAHPQMEAWVVGGVHGVVEQVPWGDGLLSTTIRAPSRGWSPGAVVAMSADGRDLALAFERDIEIWRDGVLAGRAQHPGGNSVQQLSFDPEGGRLLVTGETTMLLSVPSLEPIASWGSIVAAVLSPDGTLLALADARGGIQLLEASALVPIGLPLHDQGDPAWFLAFTPDGRHLLSLDASGRVMAWSTDVRAWLASACAMAWRDLSSAEAAELLGDQVVEPVCVGSDG